jgi:hypothetical protein
MRHGLKLALHGRCQSHCIKQRSETHLLQCMSQLLALFGLGAVSDLSLLTVPKQTLFSPGLAPKES